MAFSWPLLPVRRQPYEQNRSKGCDGRLLRQFVYIFRLTNSRQKIDLDHSCLKIGWGTVVQPRTRMACANR
jgi:hypothetical protein